jgi:hypothetical protein
MTPVVITAVLSSEPDLLLAHAFGNCGDLAVIQIAVAVKYHLLNLETEKFVRKRLSDFFGVLYVVTGHPRILSVGGGGTKGAPVFIINGLGKNVPVAPEDSNPGDQLAPVDPVADAHLAPQSFLQFLVLYFPEHRIFLVLSLDPTGTGID